MRALVYVVMSILKALFRITFGIVIFIVAVMIGNVPD